MPLPTWTRVVPVLYRMLLKINSPKHTHSNNSYSTLAWIFVTKIMGGVNFRLQSRSGDANCGQKTLIFKQI